MNEIVCRECSKVNITSLFELFNITFDFCHVIFSFVVNLIQG